VPRGSDVRHLQFVDSRRRWAMTDVSLETLQRVTLPFRLNLDGTVGQVADPAVQAFDNSTSVHEVTEADALHTTADDVQTREAHAEDDDYRSSLLPNRPHELARP